MKPRRILVAMPLYDGKPEWQTELAWDALQRQPLLPEFELVCVKIRCYSAAKGRNLLIWYAKREKCERILFLDQDVNFGPDHVRRILSHSEDVVGGLYPRLDLKELRWVAQAENFDVRPDGLQRMVEIGAGFLCVSMAAIARMESDNIHLRFEYEEEPCKGEHLWMLFRDDVVTQKWADGRVWPRCLTEDFFFCWLAKRSGFTVWADTRCLVGHIKQVDMLELHADKLLATP